MKPYFYWEWNEEKKFWEYKMGWQTMGLVRSSTAC